MGSKTNPENTPEHTNKEQAETPIDESLLNYIEKAIKKDFRWINVKRKSKKITNDSFQ